MNRAYTTPEYLLPQMGDHPVSEPAIYRSLYILESLSDYLGSEPERREEWRIRSKAKYIAFLRHRFLQEISNIGPLRIVVDAEETAREYGFNREELEELKNKYNKARSAVISEGLGPHFDLMEYINEEFPDIAPDNVYYEVLHDLTKLPEWQNLDFEEDDHHIRSSCNEIVRLAYFNRFLEDSIKNAEIELRLLDGEEHLFNRQIEPRETAEEDQIGEKPPSELSSSSILLDPFRTSDSDHLQSECSIGVMTVHHQAWAQKGLALGNLLHSVCLAPGEVTQVAVVDWQRKSSGSSVEDTTQDETVSSDIEQTRAVNEVQQAVAKEAQQGSSSTSASSDTVQSSAAFSTLALSASISAAHSSTNALTAQFSAGARDLAATSSNELTQNTAEKSQSLRSKRAAVVREVTQQESETTTARVLANYNRRHSLNVEYFEVLQLYEIKTNLQHWERCLFVPLKPIDFSSMEVVKRHESVLYNILTPEDQTAFLEHVAFEDELSGSVNGDGQEKDKEKARKENRFKKMEERAANRLKLLEAIRGFGVQVEDLTAALQSTRDQAQRAGLQANISQMRATMRDLELALDRLSNPTELQSQNLMDALQANQLALSQQIWLRMDTYRVYKMLQGKTINGQAVSSLINPTPIGVFGNCVAFRWGFKRGEVGETERAAFERDFLAQDPNSSAKEGAEVLALPTSGVFAEAVLGLAEAAEEIDNSKFWRWEESPIPILPPKIADISSRDRAKDVDLSSSDFATALAALRAQNPADVSHLGAILSQLGKGDMFRDMGGLAEASSLAAKLSELSASGATAAGDQVKEIHSKMLDTFVSVLNSDVGKAVVGEFLVPGAGPLLMNGATDNSSNSPSPADLGTSLADVTEKIVPD